MIPTMTQGILPLSGVDLTSLAATVKQAKDQEFCANCNKHKWRPLGEVKMTPLDNGNYSICQECVEVGEIGECDNCDTGVITTKARLIEGDYVCTECAEGAQYCDRCWNPVWETTLVEDEEMARLCSTCIVCCSGCGEDCCGDNYVQEKVVCYRCANSSSYVKLLISLGACAESVLARRDDKEITIEEALDRVIYWSRFEWLADTLRWYKNKEFADTEENREWLIERVNEEIKKRGL